MRYLLDTHLLLWSANGQLPATALVLINDPLNDIYFSAASLWEIAIKVGLGKPDFDVNLDVLHAELQVHGYRELPILGDHAIRLLQLPIVPAHKDPFDRLLVAQAIDEGITLVTSDRKIRDGYPRAPVLFVDR